MLTPTQLVHIAHASQAVDGCGTLSVAVCYVCGGSSNRGRAVDKWLSSGFTDHARVASPLSPHVCDACCFVMSRTSPVLGRPPKDGKDFGGNFRNYSHLWEDGWNAPAFGDAGELCANYANASKGQKPLIRQFIERQHDGPWFAAIADSGQKHVLPYATLNQPGRGGTVAFDSLVISVPSDTRLVGELCSMLTDGATKEELGRGEYRPQTWQRLGPTRVRAFEEEHGQRRGAWFSLALWVAQRGEEAVAERLDREKHGPKATNRNNPGGGGSGAEGRVPGSVQREAPVVVLGSDQQPSPERSEDECDGGRVDNERISRLAPRGATRRGLFAD